MSRQPAAIRVGPGTVPRTRRRRQRRNWRLAVLVVPLLVAGVALLSGQLALGRGAADPAPTAVGTEQPQGLAIADETPEATPTPTAPASPEATATAEPTAAATSPAIATAEPTATEAATATPEPTATAEPSPTATPAATPQPTATPTSPPQTAATGTPMTGATSPETGTGTPATTGRTYVVQPGDRLKDIAARFGVSFWDIAEENNLPNADSLSVGQVLRIPD